MRIRGANKNDFTAIERLLKDYDFELEFKHLECLVVVEDDLEVIIAVGSLQTILEAMFIVEKGIPKLTKAKALQLLLTQANTETRALNYPAYHCFVTNDSIEKVLTNREAKIVNGKVMIKWVP